MKRSLNLAAAAYGLGSTALADAALVLSRRYPKSPWDRKARMLAALSKGGGVPNPVVTQTIMRDVFVMRDSIRMTDLG